MCLPCLNTEYCEKPSFAFMKINSLNNTCTKILHTTPWIYDHEVYSI